LPSRLREIDWAIEIIEGALQGGSGEAHSVAQKKDPTWRQQ